MDGWLLFGLLAVGAFLYLVAPRRSQSSVSTAGDDVKLREDNAAAMEVDDADFRIVWAVACDVMVELRADILEPEHLLLAATYHPGLPSLLVGTADEVRDKLRASLAARSTSEEGSIDRLSFDAEMLVDRARWRAGERNQLTSLSDLLQALRECGGVFAEVLRDDLSGAPVVRRPQPGEVLLADSAGSSSGGPYRSAHGDVHVYAVDDAKTTQQFVVDVLEEEFALSRMHARFVMRETDSVGLGFVGRFPFLDAVERVKGASMRARSKQMPLAFRLYLPADSKRADRGAPDAR